MFAFLGSTVAKSCLGFAALALAIGGVVFGLDSLSYLATGYNKVTVSVKSQVPVSFEIDRAKGMIAGLVPEIQSGMLRIAQEEVAVENLAKQLESSRAQLAKEEADLHLLYSHLQSGEDKFLVGTRSYTNDQVRADVATRFERLKFGAETANKLEQVLQARISGLEAARQKLQQMISAKRQLEVDVAQLASRLEMVEVAQSASDYSLDESHLAKTKSLLKDIGARLDVAERMMGQAPAPGIELGKAHDDVLEEVGRHFGQSHGFSVSID